VSLMEKAQELVDMAKQAAGRLTGDRDTHHRHTRHRDTRHNGKAEPPRPDGQAGISEAAKDATDPNRGN